MRRATLIACAVMVLVLAALAAKSLLISVPPVRALNAPGEFHAARAKARLAWILGDQRPHPADSAADDMVRARLVAQLRRIGLKPIVRDQFACNGFPNYRAVACARVRNVIATIGPPTGKALLLSAHYDSVPVGPGAADDGIGVATLLEVGSILNQRPLRRPVMLLFNEGEELGLIGARAFLSDPLSRNVDSLLNFEARGVNGPATMFETSNPNGAAIGVFAKAVQRPLASSMSTDVARLIPNGTDVMTYKERGWLTLNFAIVGNETRYHSPGDDLAGLDARSLQHMGDQALAVTSQLSAGAPKAEGDRIFFDVLGRWFVQMPLALGAVLLLALLAAFAAIAWTRRAIVREPALLLGTTIVAVAGAWLAVTMMGMLVAGTWWRAHPGITFIAIYATALFAAVAMLRTIGGRMSVDRLRPAFWFLFLLIGGASALIAPGVIIYFLFPPALVLAGIVLRRWWRPAEIVGGLAALAVLYLTWGEMLGQLEQIFSPGPLWIVAPLASLMIIAALVEAHGALSSAHRGAVLAFAALLALAGWGVAAAAPDYSPDHQQRFTVEHVTEFPSGRSSWSILNDGAGLPAAYSRLGKWKYGKLPLSERKRWIAEAPRIADLRPPSIEPLEILRHGDSRTIRLRLHVNGAERIALIAPEDARIETAGTAGFVRPIAAPGSGGKFSIACTGRSCDGAELTIEQGSAKPIDFTVVGSRDGLPPSAEPLLRSRPPNARPQYTPDETVAVVHVKV
jgi:hypothetical protein